MLQRSDAIVKDGLQNIFQQKLGLLPFVAHGIVSAAFSQAHAVSHTNTLVQKVVSMASKLHALQSVLINNCSNGTAKGCDVCCNG